MNPILLSPLPELPRHADLMARQRCGFGVVSRPQPIVRLAPEPPSNVLLKIAAMVPAERERVFKGIYDMERFSLKIKRPEMNRKARNLTARKLVLQIQGRVRQVLAETP